MGPGPHLPWNLESETDDLVFATMSIEQVCERLGCKRSKVFGLLADSLLERAPRFGRSLRIYTASVERLLAPTSEKARKRCAVSVAGWSRDEMADLLEP